MTKGEYGVYCANCRAFIQLNTYSDYRPHYAPPDGGVKHRCPSCGDVVAYGECDTVYREDGKEFNTQGQLRTT